MAIKSSFGNRFGSVFGSRFFNAFESGGGPISPSDPYWDNVALLLKFENSATFDSSSSSVTPTGQENFSQASNPVKFGTYSGLCNYGYINYNNKNLAPGTADLTVETFAYFPTTATGIHTLWEFSGNVRLQAIPSSASTDLRLGYGTSNISNYSVSLAYDTWYHIATCRTGGNSWKTYLNGTLIGTTTTAFSTAVDGFNVSDITSRLVGYLDEFRYTKGVARYTANFDPPTEPFPTS